MELFLNQEQDSYFLKLLTNYTNSQDQIKPIQLSQSALQLISKGVIGLPSIPCLLTQEPKVLVQIVSIAKFITEISFTDSILFGQDNKEVAQVLSVFETAQKLNLQQLLDHYTAYLESRVFLVSNHVTVADLYLFTRLYTRVCDFTDQDKVGQYVHFFRWFNTIQNLPNIKEFNLQNGRIIVKSASPFVVVENKKKKKQK